MPKHTCRNNELALKDIKLINMLPKSLIYKQKQLTILLQNISKHQSKYLKIHHQYVIRLKT